MMRPKRPKIAAKISMVRILTNLVCCEFQKGDVGKIWTYSVGSAASASAALLPLMPTHTPQIKLHMPTVIPAQNSAYPVNWFDPDERSFASEGAFILEEKIMAMMTP